jgi:hypothetical protein
LVPPQIRHAVFDRHLEELLPAFERHDAAGRVLDGRDRVDVFRGDALALEVLKDVGERVDLDAVFIERCANDLLALALQLGDRAAIGEFLEDHRVADFEQHGVDEVDALARARRNQDVVGRAVDAAQLCLRLDELAQAEMALVALRGGIHRKLRALLAQRRGGRFDEAFDRDQGRVVVPADEIVFRVAGEAHCGGGYALGEQVGVGKAAHRFGSSRKSA